MADSKKPLVFKDFIAALQKRGRTEDSEKYTQLVVERFHGTLSKEQIEALTIDQIVEIVRVANTIKTWYLRQLLQEFSVSKGEK
jgi:hypothetical protein